MSDTIGSLDDCLETLRSLHRFCARTRGSSSPTHSRLWEPLLSLYAKLAAEHAARPAQLAVEPGHRQSASSLPIST